MDRRAFAKALVALTARGTGALMPPPPTPPPRQLLFGGDAMLGRGVSDEIRRNGPGYPLGPLSELSRAADWFCVNLETAISPRDIRYAGPQKAFYFRADPLATETLAAAGVDLVSLANNHALDADVAGLRDTLALLDAAGIAHVGAGENLEAASRPARLRANGSDIGVLGYCDHQEDFAAVSDRAGIRYVDVSDPATPAVLAQEVTALAARVDHAVVSFHWQPNWAPEVGVTYRTLARRVVEAGARIVWGHGPHHFQGVEWIGTGVVLYSTGDLVDDYALEPSFRNDRQLLFQVAVSDRGVDQVRAFPIELDFARTRPAGLDARRWIARRFQDMCAAVGSPVELRGAWLEVLRPSD